MLNAVKRPSRLNRKNPVGIGNSAVVCDLEKEQSQWKEEKTKYLQLMDELKK